MPNTSISESNEFRSILSNLNIKSLLLLDVDNTILQSQIELGSDQWFVQLFSQALSEADNKKLTKEEAITAALTIYHEVQEIIKVKAMENNTAQLIQSIQSTGIPVIAVTARDFCLQGATVRQLDSINIEFCSPRGFPEWLDIKDTSLRSDALFFNGILYCGGQDKGLCLKKLLTEINFKPEHVMMVDDKDKYLHHMQNNMTEMGAAFMGIRYGQADESVKNFDMQKANQQLKFILPRLPVQAQEDIKRLSILAKNDGSTSTNQTVSPPCSSSAATHNLNQFFYPSKAESDNLIESKPDLNQLQRKNSLP